MSDNLENPWTWHWGARYSESLKMNLALHGYLAALIDSGRLGEVVVDIGSGKSCPIKEVISNTGAKLIQVDIAAHENLSDENRLFLRLDAEAAINENSREIKQALAKVSEFLNLEPCCEKDPAPVDTFLLSEIINYIDYQAVIKAGIKWLKPGGRIVIINEPGRGLDEKDKVFSDKRPTNNNEVIKFLESLGLEIEDVDYSQSTYKTRIPEALSMMVLVAKKKDSIQ